MLLKRTDARKEERMLFKRTDALKENGCSSRGTDALQEAVAYDSPELHAMIAER
jgi:hypothetical protein